MLRSISVPRCQILTQKFNNMQERQTDELKPKTQADQPNLEKQRGQEVHARASSPLGCQLTAGYYCEFNKKKKQTRLHVNWDTVQHLCGNAGSSSLNQ